MNLAVSLQGYLRTIAERQYQIVRSPPFCAFFHPEDPLIHFNYAIPDAGVERFTTAELAELARLFIARERLPRLELIEEANPALPEVLAAAGYQREDRYPVLTCLRAEAISPPPPPGVEVEEIDARAPEVKLRDQLRVSREVFDTGQGEPSRPEIAWLRELLKEGRSYQARLAGALAGTSGFSAPIDGVAEITGIATREAFRRRGIGTALTAAAVAGAFARGAELVFLSAGDERAGKLYRAVGFRPAVHLQTWSLR